MSIKTTYRLIISGGGTGGHIFPAVAIANEFKERHPDTEILFVGAEGRMEMTRVPEAGYKIVGLWISGLQRRLTWSNLLFPVKVISSYFKARRIVKDFRPDAVIGTGGYASGPMMMAATRKGVPSLIQEQNSFAGLTNKQVAGKVARICVAYEGMDRYFPSQKIVLTGNPVRKDILSVAQKRNQALAHFGFDPNVKTLLIVGGSLGARTINESIIQGIEKLAASGFQMIWQTGKGYFESYRARLEKHDLQRIRVQDFVKEMDLAYAAADVVVSRAGAIAVSEICIAGKPVILVPSPNVAEDHQTKNALALVSKDAAVLVKDVNAGMTLVDTALSLLHDEARCAVLRANILKLARPDATAAIVNEIENMIRNAQRKSIHASAGSASSEERGRNLNATALVPVPVKR